MVVAAALVVAASCGSAGDDASTPPTSALDATPSTAPEQIRDRGVFVVGEGGATFHVEPGGPAVGSIREGVALPYDERTETSVRVTTPCENRGWMPLDAGVASGPYRVAIDPGHGGEETGAVGPSGLTEKEVNLDVARRAVEALDERGIPAVLTRTADYRATLAFRVKLTEDVGAEVFVSIHHNAEPDEERTTPGTEAYYQFRSDESRRLTGLVYEEVFRAYSAHDVTFVADRDAGAKYRLGPEGRDYYGVIRRSFDADVVATLLESAFISNPEEEALLRREEVRQAEAEAVARAIERFFAGEEPGAVFTEPYPRKAPAGPGGGLAGCEDPS